MVSSHLVCVTFDHIRTKLVVRFLLSTEPVCTRQPQSVCQCSNITDPLWIYFAVTYLRRGTTCVTVVIEHGHTGSDVFILKYDRVKYTTLS